MLFLEFLLCSLVIFLLWIIEGAKSKMQAIHWHVLLTTAIILGVVIIVEYFMQKFGNIAIRSILKGRRD